MVRWRSESRRTASLPLFLFLFLLRLLVLPPLSAGAAHAAVEASRLADGGAERQRDDLVASDEAPTNLIDAADHAFGNRLVAGVDGLFRHHRDKLAAYQLLTCCYRRS